MRDGEKGFLMHRIILLIGLLLAACNLQQQPPATPTLQTAPTDENLPAAASPTPGGPAVPLPTLQPTPTQLLLVTATLPAATTTTITINSGSSGGPTLDAAQADERHEINARAGATIGVNYEITITSGTIALTLQGPDGVVWQQLFATSETGRVEVEIEQGGAYEILVNRDRLDGSYALSWD